MDIDYVLACIPKINISDIHTEGHFETRYNQRQQQIPLTINEIKTKIVTEKPVTIIKQDDQKFKIGYELSSDFDLTIIISINTSKSLTMKLVTLFIEKSEKRWRKDGI
ncbi:MAG: hypothetical protein KAR85_02000 [Methanosarcinales archaeon]|nr:hypothetical protein [Methanosarcinales archaeon]